jgi:hypothetical protein
MAGLVSSSRISDPTQRSFPLNRQQVFENERHWMVILTIEPLLKVGKSGYTVSFTVKAKRHSFRQKRLFLRYLDFRTHTLSICLWL